MNADAVGGDGDLDVGGEVGKDIDSASCEDEGVFGAVRGAAEVPGDGTGGDMVEG